MSISAPHFIDLLSPTDEQFTELLRSTLRYRQTMKEGRRIAPVMDGRLQFNLFFENSTRTNLSFEVAAKRLGAIVSVVPVDASSVHKGESLEDTVLTLAAQGADYLVLRSGDENPMGRTIKALAQDGYPTSVINAGDGTIGHPTQGLLDVATTLSALGRTADAGLAGVTVAIIGDIKHSRVASSALEGFGRLGAQLQLAGPEELLPDRQPPNVVRMSSAIEDALDGADIVMTLRLQKERMQSALGLDEASYHAAFGLTHDRLALAKPGAKVMHPQPMNRGVEITSALADDPTLSLLREQVTFGVAARMAVCTMLEAQKEGQAS